jgi:hypothetical protein
VKKEARLLLGKAIDGLVLAIEHFNRPSDVGRVTAVLVLVDHAFEMLLKAAILHLGGRIRQRRAKQTLGFDACVRKGLSDGAVKFLTEEQALTLQAINGLRDAAQHYLLDISEVHLYMHAQGGVTLFRDICREVFEMEVAEHLPGRVLPVSTEPPCTLTALFDGETEALRKMLRPGTRRRTEAEARLRAMAILEGAIQGEYTQPSPAELRKLGGQLRTGKAWTDVFPGVASIEFTAHGYGPSFDLRITKKDDGVPITLVPEGTPGARVVAVRRVSELGFYNLTHRGLAAKVGLTAPKLTALRRYLRLADDEDCFKEILGHKRYSQKAVERLREVLDGGVDMDAVWREYGCRCDGPAVRDGR